MFFFQKPATSKQVEQITFQLIPTIVKNLLKLSSRRYKQQQEQQQQSQDMNEKN